MAEVNPDPRKPISPGQYIDASDSAETAAARVPDENINPVVTENIADEHIVTSDRDKAIEAAKTAENKKQDASEGKK